MQGSRPSRRAFQTVARFVQHMVVASAGMDASNSSQALQPHNKSGKGGVLYPACPAGSGAAGGVPRRMIEPCGAGVYPPRSFGHARPLVNISPNVGRGGVHPLPHLYFVILRELFPPSAGRSDRGIPCTFLVAAMKARRSHRRLCLIQHNSASRCAGVLSAEGRCAARSRGATNVTAGS